MAKHHPKYKPMQNLKARRNACGFTQEELALKVGVNRQQVRMYETGWRYPRPHTMEKLAEALGCEVKDII